MDYKNPTPVAVAIMPIGKTHYLVVERNIMPFKGGLAFPGGFVNEGEGAEAAIAREVLEETGLGTGASDWKPVVTRVTPGNHLLIFMKCKIKFSREELKRFVPNEEVSALLVVKNDAELCFSIHTEVLRGCPWY